MYEETNLYVFRFIYGLLGGPREEVEDLWAETFMRAWRSRNRFDGSPEAALSWLLQIARNSVIDAYRRRQTHGTQIDIHLDQFQAPGPQPEEQIILAEQRKRIWKLIQDLPYEDREIIVLRYVLGWRVNQIAEHLDRKENTVSKQLSRALQRLQEKWQPEEESEK